LFLIGGGRRKGKKVSNEMSSLKVERILLIHKRWYVSLEKKEQLRGKEMGDAPAR